MTNEKVLIDPLSFFSAVPKIVESVKPSPVSAVPKIVTQPIKTSAVPKIVAQPIKTSLLPIASTSEEKRLPMEKSINVFSVKPIPTIPTLNTVEELWVEKYTPKVLGDLVGNGGQISRLVSWLKSWSPTQTSDRAVLLSGPPGIGKTSTAKLVCELVGYTVLEFNASDTRGKNAVEEMASGLATNRVLTSSKLTSRVAIIMDEVDGMSGGDRGGSAALIQMIKKSKLPIICICNDRMDTKIRSLANSCLDLRFASPTVFEVAARAAVVARSEKLSHLTSESLQLLAASCTCDIRQVINSMQLDRHNTDKVNTNTKDIAMGPFDIVKGLFTSATARGWNYQKRNELFFIDYDLIPLLVQQNYVKCVEKVVDPKVWPALAKAAEYICFADSIGRAIRTDSHWNLLPEFGVMSTVGPSFACNNVLSFPEFPVWLGRQSSLGKHARLMKELRGMVPDSTTTSRNMKLSGYPSVLYSSVISRLASGQTDAIAKTVDFIDALGVPKDSLMDVLGESRLPWQPDPYSAVDSKTKAAFTRAYNAKEHLVKAGNAIKVASKKRQTENSNDDEEEEEDRSSGLIKVAKSKKKAKK